MATRRRRSTSIERNIQIINDWMEATGEDVIDMKAVAAWAISEGRWTPPVYDPRKACARELSRSAREEYYTDPQGREVRKKHVYVVVDPDGQRRWLWVDIVSAKPEPMHKSLQMRRRSALSDVIQLNTDRHSYNDNNPYGAQLPMSFNFDEDIAELENPTEYPEEAEEENEEDDD